MMSQNEALGEIAQLHVVLAEDHAEIERLRDLAWKHGNRADEAERERDELRAENERLRAAFENSEAACLIQVQIVRAENEWLKVAEQRRTEEVQTAMAKVERLHALLADIDQRIDERVEQLFAERMAEILWGLPDSSKAPLA